MLDFNFEGFKLICQSTEWDLLDYLTKQLKILYGENNCIATTQYVFAKGTCPVILVAHLDTVHSTLPHIVVYDDKIGVVMSPTGIGGDDRCGVYQILKVITEMSDNRPYVLFTTKEETGCYGARQAAEDLVDEVNDIKFMIELDRRGSNDACFYKTSNYEFEAFIESYGFKTAYGSLSDISYLTPKWNIASVNLSCGYYNAHTNSEYVVVDEMMDVTSRVIDILKDVDTVDKFPQLKIDTTKKDNKENNVGRHWVDNEILNQDELANYMDERDLNYIPSRKFESKECSSSAWCKNFGDCFKCRDLDNFVYIDSAYPNYEDEEEALYEKYGRDNVRDPFYASSDLR